MGSIQELSGFYLKSGFARPLKYTPVNEKTKKKSQQSHHLIL